MHIITYSVYYLVVYLKCKSTSKVILKSFPLEQNKFDDLHCQGKAISNLYT